MRYLTVKEIAEVLRVSTVTVKRHIANGKIKAVKLGSIHRITEDDFAKFLSQSTLQAVTSKN
jgi:excisionase family DNA binding protein